MMTISYKLMCIKKQLVYLLMCLTFTYVMSIGDKALEACRNYGQTMLECHNILYPKERVRVPIDLLLFPHMVMIGFRKELKDPPVWKCGGTLIDRKWVLTAAHCSEDPKDGTPNMLRVGTATFEFDEVEDLAQERNIAEIVVHPTYKPPSKYHDIALMRASPPFMLTRDIRIACLKLDDDLPQHNLTVIGFGKTVSEATDGSQTLMKVEVDVVSNAVCNRTMKFLIRRKVLEHGLIDDQLCAGDFEHGGRDSCQGDSGGPLQVMEDKIDCLTSFPLHTVVGVTSFGRDCGRKMAPGVYTKVSSYIEWIESVVWP